MVVWQTAPKYCGLKHKPSVSPSVGQEFGSSLPSCVQPQVSHETAARMSVP